MTGSIRNLFRVKEIRNRILITLALLLCYRIGFFIPLPGVNVKQFLDQAAQSGSGGITGILNVLTGARLTQAAIFALGVMPYISASIIFSLLTKVVPSLEKLAKEGQSGQRKINQYTRLATIPICLIQSMFVIFGVLMPTLGTPESMLYPEIESYWYAYIVVVMVSLTAGTLFIMWIGEQITEHGIGNGISMIIMAGIISSLWTSFSMYFTPTDGGAATEAYQNLLLFVVAWIVMVFAVVFMTKAQRRIPIQDAKQTRGRRVYGGQRHFLPIKVNHAGVMPIIFASALLIVPSIVGSVLGWSWLEDSFTQATGFLYVASFVVLIFFFSFFWTSLMFQPNEVAENLQESGAFIPGIRPGKNTATFLEETMFRITLAGSAFLAIVSVLPNIVSSRFQGIDQNLLYFMSGTSILIVVGVALDMVEKVNALLVMRNYEGIVREAGSSGAPTTGAGWGRSR